MYNIMLNKNTLGVIGGGKGGAMGLQPHLISGVLHRILIFYHIEIFSFQENSPT